MTDEIGVTVGFITPNKLVFATKKRLNFGDLVCIKDEIDGKEREILARVIDMVFMDLSSLSTASPALGTPSDVMFELMGKSKIDRIFLITQCVLLGYIDDDLTLKPVRTVIQPGLKVFIPNKELLKQIIMSKTKMPIYIGTLSLRNDVDVCLDGEKLFSPTLITGITGSGKTTFATILAKEASKHGIFTIIFDLTGEYVGLSSEEWVNFVPSTRIQIDFSSLGPDQIAKLIDATETEEVLILTLFQKYGKFESFKEFLEALEAEGHRFHRSIVRRMKLKLCKLREILGYKGVNIKDLHKPDTVTIFDLSKIPTKICDIIIYFLSEQILRESSQNFFPNPKLVIFDAVDAYRIGDLSIDAMLNLSRIGRKYKTGLCIITQSPSSLPRSLISMCENLVTFRLVNNNDITLIAEVFGREIMEIEIIRCSEATYVKIVRSPSSLLLDKLPPRSDFDD